MGKLWRSYGEAMGEMGSYRVALEELPGSKESFMVARGAMGKLSSHNTTRAKIRPSYENPLHTFTVLLNCLLLDMVIIHLVIRG